MSEDLRIAPRRRTLKGARIVFNDGASTLNCQVRNLSETGGLLKLASVLGVPDAFDLLLDDGSRFACTVVRRTATDLGVQFS